MKSFIQLKKNLKKNVEGMTTIKVALLGDSSTQLLNQSLKGSAFDLGFNFNLWEANFNQIESQVFNLNSELYSFKPDIVIIFKCSQRLLGKYNKLNFEEQSSLATNEINELKHIHKTISDNIKTNVIYYNYVEIDDSIFGSYSNKIEQSFLFQLRKLNFELMLEATQNMNMHICDISIVQNNVGRNTFFKSSIYIISEMVLNIDVLPIIASKTNDIICSLYGKSKKCLILDLDNTLWGGIIGDDGIENIQIGHLGIGKAFTEFQRWIKKLKNRGIILAICSKNNEEVAKEPFIKHKDMIIKLHDISVFIANWDNKVDNIKKIQSVLNIGYDSMVFIDDNPFERNIVKEGIPEICVPELPEDPAEYLDYLATLNLFETNSFSTEDTIRTELYKIEAKRVQLKHQCTNENDFLKSLNMLCSIEAFNKFNTPRVAQLSQRSNQFNLRTVRYTDNDIQNIIKSPNYYSLAFTLEDKFGDNGLISAVVLKKQSIDVLFIESWFMSCRVLKRGMEFCVLNSIVTIAKNNNIKYIMAEYIPTLKNVIVKDLYSDLGFKFKNNVWELNVTEYQEKETYINIKINTVYEKK